MRNRRILCCLVLFIFCLAQTQTVYGIPLELRKYFNKNILYRDPKCSGGGGAAAADSTINSVFMVGDSITHTAKKAPHNMKQKFRDKGIDAVISGTGAGTVTSAPPYATGDKLSGLQAIDRYSSDVRNADAVIVAHGTNHFPGEMNSAITRMVNKIKSVNDSATIFWVNTYTNSSGAYSQSASQRKNRTISNKASELNYNVIDITSVGIELNSDGIHPEFDESGIGKWRDAIIDKIASGDPVTDSVSGAACCGGGGGASFGPGVLPPNIKEPYNSIFTAAAQKHNMDPAFLVAIFYNEQFGYPRAVEAYRNHEHREPPPPYGSGEPWAVSSAAAQGPFQFIPSTWTTQGQDGNGDGRKDPDDLTDSAFAAAFYLGPTEGATLPTTEQKVLNAAGAYYGDGPTGEYAATAWEIFQLVKADGGGGAGGGVSVGGGDCAGAGEAVTANGYAWPVDIPKSDINDNYSWPCVGTCHHDGTPAFDLSSKSGSSTGKAVFAISDGTIESLEIYRGLSGCYELQLKSSKDDYVYYYTHIRRPAIRESANVKVGDKIAEIGESRCATVDLPHLHIDRGSPKGEFGGRECCRDRGMVSLMNGLYESLP